jgi:Xaa-Pro aminopeptidase
MAENAALPHGSGTDRFLQKDEFVLIDAGGKWGGYVSDITRTFALPDSEISDEHLEVWEIVRRAQLAPASLLRLLERADRPQYAWLDDRARETVKKGMAAHGVPPGRDPDYTTFTHRLGHGIGLEGHESPYAVQGSLGDRLILPGHTLTFEPGVYIPKGSDVGDKAVRGLGVRLEDVVVIREDKEGRMRAEWLTGPVDKWGDV